MQQGPHGGDGSAAAADHPLVLRNTEGSPWWRRQRSARGLEQPVINFLKCSILSLLCNPQNSWSSPWWRPGRGLEQPMTMFVSSQFNCLNALAVQRSCHSLRSNVRAAVRGVLGHHIIVPWCPGRSDPSWGLAA